MDSLRRIQDEVLNAEYEMDGEEDPTREALAMTEVQLIATKRLLEMGLPASDYLWQIIQEYFKFRGLKMAKKPEDAFLFLVSEVGEMADAMVHGRQEWVRNNARDRNLDDETSDVLMMLLITAKLAGIDPVTSLLKKMKEKGFDYLASSGTSGS